MQPNSKMSRAAQILGQKQAGKRTVYVQLQFSTMIHIEHFSRIRSHTYRCHHTYVQ